MCKLIFQDLASLMGVDPIKNPAQAGFFRKLALRGAHAGTGSSCCFSGAGDLAGVAVLPCFFSSSAFSFFACCSTSRCNVYHSNPSHMTNLLSMSNDRCGSLAALL